MSNEEPTILIIGAGTFGTSTAYHLSQQYQDPSRISIIDRWNHSAALQEKHAAAIDVNRIIRTDYESPLYCNLANEAIHPWFWDIALQGYFRKTGWIVLDRKEGGFGNAVRKTFVKRGGDYTREVGAQDLEKYDVLKGIDSGEFGKRYFNPEAGWCDAEKATANFMKVAVDKGVKSVKGEVQELLFDSRTSRIEGVRTNDGRVIKADKVVLAAGAWTSSLLAPLEDRLRMQRQERIERQVTAVGRLSAYYTLSEKETQTIVDSKMPIVVIGGQVDIIPPSPSNRTVKINDLQTEVVNTITTSSSTKITAPSKQDQNSVPEKLKRESEKVIRLAMPEWTKGRSPDRWRLCYDAVTPTEDWLMCKHPNSKLSNLYLAVGGSFHSYKQVTLNVDSPIVNRGTRFMPIAGGYMCKVLKGNSNGEEKDRAWGWKSDEQLKEKKGKEFGDSPRKGVRIDLKEFEGEGWRSKL